MLEHMKQADTDKHEREMLTQLNPQMLADYYLLKEKGDDVRVYMDEKRYLTNKQVVNDSNQLVLSKDTKITIAQPKQPKQQYDYKLNAKGMLVVNTIKDEP